MLLFSLLFSFFLLQLTVATGISQGTKQGEVTFSNSVRFLFDTDGNQVDAYGSKINCKELLSQAPDDY